MKNEQHIDNPDLNPFEAPANLWDRVEAGLDQKKSKRRGIYWWSAAAGIALLAGFGYSYFQSLSDRSDLQKELIAKIVTLEVQKDSVKTEERDTTSVREEFHIDHIKPAAYDFKPEPEPKVEEITTAVPFMNVPPAPNKTTYTWTTPNPFGNGGNGSGQGGGSGTGYVDYSNVTISAPRPTTTIQDQSISRERMITLNPSDLQSVGIRDVNVAGAISATPGATVQSSSTTVTNGLMNSKGLANAPTKPRLGYLTPVDVGRINPRSESGIDSEQRSNSSYESIQENAFKPTSEDPLSTFSIDVDGASYSDVRGMINRNNLPNPSAVRLEEFINYFPYEYEEPSGEHPFSINTEFAECPWNKKHQLLKIGIKGESIEKAQLPTNNLVFLLDVSGSMNNPEKLELLKKGFRLLVNELREEDRVAIAVYAGAAGLVLPPTSGANKDQILDALNKLRAGGSTAGGEGINLAYKTAEKYFDPQGNNRIILATDGDFNVGVSNNDALVELIEEKRKSGVYLTVLGFGHDNFRSDKMEKIANNGNGNFSFIDNILEAKKVLVTEMGATLKTIAKDVKIQVEFNPAHVSSYRLLGYENRMLQHQDFANDTIDAGELGAGHTVTAVYEVIPPGAEKAEDSNDGTELKYSKVEHKSYGFYAEELATVKFRYKHPDGVKSKLIEQAISTSPEMKGSPDFEFIQSVIEFGLLMRQSQYAGAANYDAIIDRATAALGEDKFGYRKEFIMLVEKAKLLADPQLE